MKKEREKRICREKIWVRSLAILLFFVLVFRNAKTVTKETEERCYQVYCLGDSITYGSGLSNEERATASYPARLEQMLGARYTVTNYGVPGATLQDTMEKSYRKTGYVDVTEEQSPDILIIMLGTNDSRSVYWDAGQYKEEYVQLVQELQNTKSHPYLYIMAPLEAFPGADGSIIYGIDNEVISGQIRCLVKEIADQTGAGMIDLYAVTEGHSEYFGDGVHPNAQGYAILAQTIADRIKQDEQAGIYQ